MTKTLQPVEIRGDREAHRRSLGFAPPDFLWNLMALTNLMRLSFRERRTRDRVQSNVAGNPGRDDKEGVKSQWAAHLSFVILRGCDFFDFSCFWYIQPECFSELPQDRHPERSASRIYRLTEGLQRVVEGPRRCLLADAIRSFPATNYKENQKKSQALSEAEGSAVRLSVTFKSGLE
jgi:hypothetical protein